jgi:hypothetical protein
MSNVPKMLILGLGGIAWSALVARSGNGKLPAMTALMRRGTALRLIDDVPTNRAGAWATLSTGVLPHQHGIVTFEEPWPGGLRPTGRASWRYAPLWQRLGAAGLTTMSVAWPFTTPGATWEGVHIDDRLARASGRDWQDWLAPRDVIDARWRDALSELRVHPTDISGDLLAPFVPMLGAVDQRTDRALIDLAMMIARLSTNHAALQHLLGEAEWDVAFAFHSWLADIQQRFAGLPAPYDAVVDAAWTLLDTMIAITVQAVPRDTAVVLVSLGWQSEPGFVIAAGAGIPRSVRADVARSVDIVPTVLARYGLRDPLLGGRIVIGKSDDILDTLPPAPDLAPQQVVDRDALARVEAAGYAAPGVPVEWTARRLLDLAALTMPHDPVAAGRFAEHANGVAGDSAVGVGLVAAAAVAGEQYDSLAGLADRIARVAPGHIWESLIRGGHHAARGELDRARPYLVRVEAEGQANERMRAGAAWLLLKRPADARRVFEAIVAVEPLHIDARVGLGIALASLDRIAAEQTLRQALIIDPARSDARTILCDILRQLGRAPEAERIMSAGTVYRRD